MEYLDKPQLAGWARHIEQPILVKPDDLQRDGYAHRALARTRFKALRASPWALVELPFLVTEPIQVKWPGRQAIATKYESWMEYKPYVTTN